MSAGDYFILCILAVLMTVAVTYIIKQKKAGRCIGCSECKPGGCEKNKVGYKEIEKTLGTKVGVCPFSALKDELIDCRKKGEIPAAAQSVITFAFPYKVKDETPENISRYSAVKDYHIVVGEILKDYCIKLKEKYKEFEFVGFTDNSPIPEVKAAALSGLGVRGKNGLLITEKYGSFVFLGEIVTDMYITPKERKEECIGCKLCEKACPVGLNKQNCLSALTQKKGDLTEDEKEVLRKHSLVWGCDICQNVCPMNRDKAKTDIKEFLTSYRGKYISGEDITSRAYAWRGENVIRRNAENIENNKEQQDLK